MNFQDIINIMLPPQGGFVPGVNGGVGWRYNPDTGKRTYHAGVDFNYHYPDDSKLGQQGFNLAKPPVDSPVEGIVTRIGKDTTGKFDGTVVITDQYGAEHVIRHLDAFNENLTKDANGNYIVNAGDNIGTMGRRGDANKDGIAGEEYDQYHVHYEVLINGKPVDPMQYWDNGWGDGDGSCQDDISALDMLYDWLGIPSIPDSLSRYFTRATQWRPAGVDPLTLDLDGDGIETVGINTNNPILFDHDGDGVKTATGWIGSDDGLLVLDRNNNGTIDNGKELFGDNTVMSNGQTAADGFAALADLDSNAD